MVFIYIYYTIDIDVLKKNIKGIDIWLLLVAFFAINVSKILSVARISLFYKAIGVELKVFESICLYYLGMFYNAILPGGIGGDGYKIYRLYKDTQVKLSRLTSATILDRLSGIVAIAFLLISVLVFMFLEDEELLLKISICMAVLLLFMLCWKLFLGKYFRYYKAIGFSSVYWAVWVQVFELSTILFLALSLGIENQYQYIAILFFISSILSVIPISIGGLGIREVIFMNGFIYLGIQEEAGVALGFMFLIHTSGSNLFCGLCMLKRKK